MLQIVYFILAAVLVGIDQVTKLWASSQLGKAGKVLELWPGVFEFRYSENTGVAFSLLEGQRWLFIPLTLITSVLIAVMLVRSPMRRRFFFSFPCALILAGGIGNLMDRVAYGFVIDFLYVRLIDFPIFNFADCCVVVGAILMFIAVLFGMKKYEEMPLRTLLFNILVKEKEPKEQNDG